MPSSKRIQYIDVAKFLGILLVTFSHGYKEGIATCFIFSFHIPVFFFLNGMTLKLDGISFGDFLVKKLKGYIVPALGLGLFCVLLDAIIRTSAGLVLDDVFFFRGFALTVNQIRFMSIWFLPAVFFCDLFLYGIYRACKGKIFLTGLGVLALLAFGIVYNKFYKAPLYWNIDTAFFATTFTYFGFLFTSKKMSRIYEPLMRTRWIPLLVGVALMVVTYYATVRNYELTHTHLAMFMNFYDKYYLTIPFAVIGSLGFTLICRGLTNSALAFPVKFNLMLLAIHQPFTFPLFQIHIARSWWLQAAGLPAESLNLICFVLAMTAFSAVISVIMYGIILVTPFSFIINKKRYPLFGKIKEVAQRF